MARIWPRRSRSSLPRRSIDLLARTSEENTNETRRPGGWHDGPGAIRNTTHGAGWEAVTELQTASVAKPWEGLEGRDRHAACMIAAQAGDRSAFDILVAELSPLVWHVARSNGLDRTSAEDVVQTVWLALLRHLHRLSEPSALAGWPITNTRRAAPRVQARGAGQVELSSEGAEQMPTTHPAPQHEGL